MSNHKEQALVLDPTAYEQYIFGTLFIISGKTNETLSCANDSDRAWMKALLKLEAEHA